MANQNSRVLKRFLLFSAVFLFIIFSGCKSSKYTNAPKPEEQYAAETEQPLVSALTIPVDIPVADLENSLNARLTGVLYDDNSFTDNGNDELMLKVTKAQPITMFLSGNTIKYRVPVALWVKQKLFIGAAEAEGQVALNLKTTYRINPDWSLATQTEVEYHEWLTKPVLKTGIGNINIETLANLALKRSKNTLTQTLDRTISQQFTLRPYVQEAWNALQAPVLLDSAYRMWVKTTPVSIAMTPLVTAGNTMRGKISVQCLNDVTFGEKPVFRQNSSLPNLTLIQDAPEEFQVRIATDVPFAEAERLARNLMTGQVFESGKKKVTVEDIQLWGNNDKVVVNAKLNGSFNGNIYFIGKPVMNGEKNRIEVTDLDFHTDTRSFLLKSAAWLFSGPIKKRMREAMTFPLDENISALKSSIQETLNYYQIQPGVVLTGTVDSINVEKTRVTATGIRVDLYSKGKLHVDVKGL